MSLKKSPFKNAAVQVALFTILKAILVVKPSQKK